MYQNLICLLVQDNQTFHQKHVNSNHIPQGAKMSCPIGTKKTKIMKYIQDSGVVIGGENFVNPHQT